MNENPLIEKERERLTTSLTIDAAFLSVSIVSKIRYNASRAVGSVDDVDDALKIQIEGSGSYLDNLDEFAKGNKNFDDVLDDYAKAYADKVNSNKSWEWMDIKGAENLTPGQMKEIRDLAKTNKYIPEIKIKQGTNFPDFEASDVIYKIDGKATIEYLPEDMWLKSDKVQFYYLDSKLPGGVRPEGYTWHHSEISGRMELVEYGVHNSTWHKGGRAPGGWADAKR